MGKGWARSSRLYATVSVVLAITTGVLVHGYLSRAARAADRNRPAWGPDVGIVVAARPVHRSDVLSRQDLAVRMLPATFAPPGSLEDIDEAAGRVALSDLASDEVVTATRLARVRAGPVASLVPEGLRAFAVQTSLPTGTVVPGDRVDVLATFGSGQPYTETIVEGVEVLLVLGGRSPPEGEQSDLALDIAAAGIEDTLTLIVLVSPTQQEDLAFARAFADLSISIAPAEARMDR
jgi:Flp pilus assembly protein CpaB